MSEPKKTFAEKLVAVGEAIGTLEKSGYNNYHDYNYLTESDVKRAVGKALRAFGLYVESVVHEVLPGSDFTHAMVRTTVVISDGDNCITSTGVGSASDKGDKSFMKAEAAALKYALTSLFLIPTGDDPEADGAKPTKLEEKPEVKKPASKKAAEKAPPSDDRQISLPGSSGADTSKTTEYALKFTTSIANAGDEEALKKLAEEIGRAKDNLTAEDFGTVKAAFKARMAQLKGGK